MYVMSCEDSSFEDMYYVARLIAREVEELGGTWGAYVYNHEMAVAEYNDGESSVNYFEMDISKDIDISVVRDNVSDTIRAQYECWHEYDCCGCWFLSNLSIILQYAAFDDKPATFIVRIAAARNI